MRSRRVFESCFFQAVCGRQFAVVIYELIQLKIMTRDAVFTSTVFNLWSETKG